MLPERGERIEHHSQLAPTKVEVSVNLRDKAEQQHGGPAELIRKGTLSPTELAHGAPRLTPDLACATFGLILKLAYSVKSNLAQPHTWLPMPGSDVIF